MSAFAEATVVIPTRNRVDYLHHAIESVRSQRDVSWALVVVDDASEDGTAAYLSTLDDHRIRSLRLESHEERAVARNAGLAVVSTRTVLFLDDDDLLRPQALCVLLAGLERDRRAFGAAGAVTTFDGAGHRRRLIHPRRTIVRDVLSDVMYGWTDPPGALLFRTDAIRAAGGWPVTSSATSTRVTAEDQALLLALALEGPVVLVPDTVLEHRLHRGQHRPPENAETERELREAFIAGLHGERRRVAERALAARTEIHDGIGHWTAGDARAALRSFSRAVRIEPRLALSPLAGPRVRSLWARAVLGSVAGDRVAGVLTGVVRGVRAVRRRSPGVGTQADEPTR